MAKNKRSRAKHLPPPKPRPEQAQSFPPLMLGAFQVPKFDGASTVFGADIEHYPDRALIPAVDRKFGEVFSALFYRGGSLSEHGLKLKTGIDNAAAMMAIRAWMSSFAPKHEHKTETVAWALSEWCEPA